MSLNKGEVDLTGLIDMHIHTAPDVRPRLLDDVQAARQAEQAGMKAIVLKSHIAGTADRAAIAQNRVMSVRVFGGIALNKTIGGLNPAAVEAALVLGARVVWMPTISAQNHMEKHREDQIGIRLLTREGHLRPELFEIIDLIKQHDAVLATGHVSASETELMVREGRKAGIDKVVVTHPEVPWINMPVGQQLELLELGACFERCFASTLPQGGGISFSRIVSAICRVGVGSTVLATDAGLASLPAPVEAIRTYIQSLLAEGITEHDIRIMASENPGRLLGLK